MFLSRISFFTGGALLFVLMLARMVAPEWVVGKNLGFVLAFVSSAAFFLGLAERRGLGSNSVSLGRPLILFASFFTVSLIDVLLGLDYYLLPASSPRMLIAFSPVVLFLVAAWWLALTKTTQELARLRPLIWLTFAASAGCVFGLVVYWRGYAS